jgi:hypothetical protein
MIESNKNNKTHYPIIQLIIWTVILGLTIYIIKLKSN